MRKQLIALGLCLALTLSVAAPVFAHCQIPCGIYNDDVRFIILAEHITTIEKSMKLIDELSTDPKKNANQIARWVANKEKHADELAKIVTEYFLQQRVKPAKEGDKAGQEAYVKKLTLCHQLLVGAMKAKQTTDQKHVDALRDALHNFSHVYTGKTDSASGSAKK